MLQHPSNERKLKLFLSSMGLVGDWANMTEDEKDVEVEKIEAVAVALFAAARSGGLRELLDGEELGPRFHRYLSELKRAA